MDTQNSALNYKDWLDLYWKYFQLHSEQRIKMVQFYLSLIVVLFGALFTLHSMETRIITAEIGISIGIGIISLVFAVLDHRTSILIKDAENAIKAIEASTFQNREDLPLKLFTYSEENDRGRIYFSYSRCIRFPEFAISILGFILAWMICADLF